MKKNDFSRERGGQREKASVKKDRELQKNEEEEKEKEKEEEKEEEGAAASRARQTESSDGSEQGRENTRAKKKHHVTRIARERAERRGATSLSRFGNATARRMRRLSTAKKRSREATKTRTLLCRDT